MEFFLFFSHMLCKCTLQWYFKAFLVSCIFTLVLQFPIYSKNGEFLWNGSLFITLWNTFATLLTFSLLGWLVHLRLLTIQNRSVLKCADRYCQPATVMLRKGNNTGGLDTRSPWCSLCSSGQYLVLQSFEMKGTLTSNTVLQLWILQPLHDLTCWLYFLPLCSDRARTSSCFRV